MRILCGLKLFRFEKSPIVRTIDSPGKDRFFEPIAPFAVVERPNRPVVAENNETLMDIYPGAQFRESFNSILDATAHF